jgi:uncharacterized membrane protein YfcA
VITDLLLTLLAALAAAYALAMLSAVAGFGGGVLLPPVFTTRSGLRVAVPVLTLTQITGNASRVALTTTTCSGRRGQAEHGQASGVARRDACRN